MLKVGIYWYHPLLDYDYWWLFFFAFLTFYWWIKRNEVPRKEHLLTEPFILTCKCLLSTCYTSRSRLLGGEQQIELSSGLVGASTAPAFLQITRREKVERVLRFNKNSQPAWLPGLRALAPSLRLFWWWEIRASTETSKCPGGCSVALCRFPQNSTELCCKVDNHRCCCDLGAGPSVRDRDEALAAGQASSGGGSTTWQGQRSKREVVWFKKSMF
jgi:hypothetical protein